MASLLRLPKGYEVNKRDEPKRALFRPCFPFWHACSNNSVGRTGESGEINRRVSKQQVTDNSNSDRMRIQNKDKRTGGKERATGESDQRTVKLTVSTARIYNNT